MQRAHLVVPFLALAMPSHAQGIDPAAVQLWDVIHTSDGSVLKGVIVEEVPGTSVRIVIVGGTSIVVELAKVTRFTKELNPTFTVAPARPGADSPSAPVPRPPRVATSGLRLGFSPGLAYHTAADASTFSFTARAGYEVGLDQWGLTPGLVVDYTPDVGTYDADGVGIAAGTRAAFRASAVSPFVGFGLGVDNVGGDVSLAMHMGAGIDLLVHRRVALSGDIKYHRGWGDTYTETMSYVAFGMGVEIRL